VCGCCSLEHDTKSCNIPRSNFLCPNCKGRHEAGNRNCQAQIKAVARFTAFLDSK
jgi:hypothetical protein